jgi:regulator of RNase E activity RraA
MNNDELYRRFADSGLTTAHLTDGCVRAGVAVRCAPTELQPVFDGARIAGRVAPARHAGSVDVFLEVIDAAAAGDVLVVDNGGRLGESCVGDLVALEAQSAALGGIVIWGLHRDTADIVEIGLPVFSLGRLPTGPLSVHSRESDALTLALVGEWMVGPDDIVFGDDDGVLFVPAARVDEVLTLASAIRDTERRQAELIRGGRSLREQVRFTAYLEARRANPSLTFREHLSRVGGAIEV